MSNRKRIIAIIVFFIFAVTIKNLFFSNSETAPATSPATAEQAEKVTAIQISGNVFGTSYHITFRPNEVNETPEQIQEGLTKFFSQFNSEFSTYDPNSLISRFNKFDQAERPFPITADFAAVIKAADRIREQTLGYEEITVYSLVKAWGFGPGQAQENLSDADVKQMLQHVGPDKYSLIENSNNTYALVKHDPKVEIDLSSIAKGYAVDLAAKYLADRGATNFLVEIGGEIVTRGNNPSNKPWQVAIEQPREDAANSANTIISLTNKALATSGHYRNFRYVDGKRITHEIDPFTGYSVTHDTVSLTVIADDCMTADGFSTGLYVMGADKALEVAEKLNLAIFVIQYQDGKFITRQSSAFAKMVESEKTVQ
ncbi:hypothetical protein CJP74_04065 [Psittacicella melopsittaci]|uniref:FAD:protein FMN transferase n=1 Tax=Psittacicella melopsittaci TaxID=2028576 RepID=A0A3A1Y646_9GAMM|nr:FAD:protein FMN transferase [Psittacicella melopsittaci]RIY32668.1 hypothetical protein CJP74_04065 [Psittacicella melopsittaci]